LSEELGEQLVQAICLHYLGEIAGRERHWNAARGLLERATAVHRGLGDPWGIAHERWGLGYLGLAQSNYSAARAAFDEALVIERELGRKKGVAHNLLGLGWVSLEQGLLDDAERLFAEAVGYDLEVGRTPKIVEGLEGLAGAAVQRRQAERAPWLLGAAHSAHEGMGHRAAFPERATVDRWRAAACRMLGDAGADAAWAAGRATSVGGAVALAQNHSAAQSDRHQRPAGLAATLSDRERQVLRLAAMGKTNHEIAHELTLSEHTVGQQRASCCTGANCETGWSMPGQPTERCTLLVQVRGHEPRHSCVVLVD
jgi:DNA-binding CsgD family transcriptional regulator